MDSAEEILEYELIDISIETGYVLPEDEITTFVREDVPGVKNAMDDKTEVMCDADGIPMGWTKSEIKVREKIIKDFYVKWIAEHPSKAILNKDLNKFIHVKYQSINETSNKAARSYASTITVFKLTEILENAIFIEEDNSKSNNNQKRYEKMLIMKYKEVKLMVGLQRTTKEHVQYSISVPTTKTEG